MRLSIVSKRIKIRDAKFVPVLDASNSCLGHDKTGGKRILVDIQYNQLIAIPNKRPQKEPFTMWLLKGLSAKLIKMRFLNFIRKTTEL